MLSAKSLMEKLAKVFIGKIKITVHSNMQSNGSQIFVCNHPTGIADGQVIWSTLSKERPWFTSAVKLASKYDIPLIPINLKARNSFLFYVFDFIHHPLIDITLFNEVLNKKNLLMK